MLVLSGLFCLWGSGMAELLQKKEKRGKAKRTKGGEEIFEKWDRGQNKFPRLSWNWKELSYSSNPLPLQGISNEIIAPPHPKQQEERKRKEKSAKIAFQLPLSPTTAHAPLPPLPRPTPNPPRHSICLSLQESVSGGEA